MGYAPAVRRLSNQLVNPGYTNPNAVPGVYGGRPNTYNTASPLVQQLMGALQQPASLVNVNNAGVPSSPYRPTLGGGIQRVIPGPDGNPKNGAPDYIVPGSPKTPDMSIPATPQGPSTAMYRPGSQPYAMNSRPYMGLGGPAGAGGYYA